MFASINTDVAYLCMFIGIAWMTFKLLPKQKEPPEK